MKFFIPEAGDSEKVYSEISIMVRSLGYNTNGERYYGIEYRDKGVNVTAQVGKAMTGTREKVIAIFNAGETYLVVTPLRGIIGGLPVLVGSNEVVSVELFE